jgi:hypothetical protein
MNRRGKWLFWHEKASKPSENRRFGAVFGAVLGLFFATFGTVTHLFADSC